MKGLIPDRRQLLAAMTFSPESGIGYGRPPGSSSDVRHPATGQSPRPSHSRAAYVIADDHGSCLDATDAALEMLGIDIDEAKR